ncbi:hypothetical protein ACU4GI_10445 [Cupriavidus basilensis]|uniref:hypothetical protein n=1 Tax=Cupriavidus TaxID=106589 RepID=UPI001267908E|nr:MULTISPECIES: hypothetical protein [Cupriavidus]MDF3882051.1 hypothetical protein [Cupriavidus basilensis]
MMEMQRPYRSLCGFLLAVLAAGCTSYKYVPPKSDAGRQCVTTCETNKQICITGKEQVAAVKEQACETRRANTLATCLATAANDKGKEQCTKRQAYCSSYASTHSCDSAYQACYIQCGGQVIEVED